MDSKSKRLEKIICGKCDREKAICRECHFFFTKCICDKYGFGDLSDTRSELFGKDYKIKCINPDCQGLEFNSFDDEYLYTNDICRHCCYTITGCGKDHWTDVCKNNSDDYDGFFCNKCYLWFCNRHNIKICLCGSFFNEEENKVYVIAGLISAGKTSLGKSLDGKYIGNKLVTYIPEPADEWEKSGMLKIFYDSFAKDPKKTEMYEPFLFEMTTFLTRLLSMKKKIDEARDKGSKIFVVDSYMTISREVYMKKLVDEGRITPQQLKIYDYFYKPWQENYDEIKPTKYIYLDTKEEICIERKNKRDRESERSGVSIEYLKSLKTYFNKFFINSQIPFERINGDKSDKEVTELLIKIIEQDLKKK